MQAVVEFLIGVCTHGVAHVLSELATELIFEHVAPFVYVATSLSFGCREARLALRRAASHKPIAAADRSSSGPSGIGQSTCITPVALQRDEMNRNSSGALLRF